MAARKIVSIDLPWSADNYTAATFYEISESGKLLNVTGFAKSLEIKHQDYFTRIAEELSLGPGSVDYILIDIPIGGLLHAAHVHEKFRAVEQAFTNSSFFSSSGNPSKKIQFPRIQGAKEHAENGINVGQGMLKAIGHDKTSVLEIFPQVTLPQLVKKYPAKCIFIEKLKSHKSGIEAPARMLDLLKEILSSNSQASISLEPSDNKATADLNDSILGALPMLDLLTKGSYLTSDVCWLLHTAPVDHPSTGKNKRQKAELRKGWIASAQIDDFHPGIMQKGILTYKF